jgi:hypothetical protein
MMFGGRGDHTLAILGSTSRKIAMDEQQRSLLRRRMRAAVEEQPEFATLRTLLLEVGGVELVAPPWRDCGVPALIHAGFVMKGPVRLRIMERSACHRNLSRLWGRMRSGLVGIGTGYALSGDGLWRQHSWGVWRRGIVETTQERVKYFGCLLEGQDADSFAEANGCWDRDLLA